MRFILWVSNYLRAFGVRSGLPMFGSIFFIRWSRSKAPRPLRIPGCSGLAWVRPGVSDSSIFQQVFVSQEYRMNEMAQFRRLEAAYHALLAEGERPLIID